MAGNLMIANRQWANRPDDERYTSLETLQQAVSSRREHSLEFSRPLKALAERVTVSGRELDGELTLHGSSKDVPFSHWSFGQLCSRVWAPAGYLRTLPSAMALSNLQWGMLHPPEEYDADAKVLIENPSDGNRDGRTGSVRAFTSTTYGRIWDAEVVDSVMRMNQDGRWQIPAASYASSDPKRATTLYASDHDVWLFLVDPERPIERARYIGPWDSKGGIPLAWPEDLRVRAWPVVRGPGADRGREDSMERKARRKGRTPKTTGGRQPHKCRRLP